MEAYKKWVRRNRDYVHSLESLANGLTWLLPERFSDSEIGPEAVTAFLGILTAINEHIIDTTPTRGQTAHSEPHAFPYSLCISALKDLETLVEVVAQHYYGDTKKWDFLAVTEAIKVFVRLSLFQSSGYKMLLHGGQTPNIDKQFDSSSPMFRNGASSPREFDSPGYSKDTFQQNRWSMEGKALSALSRFGQDARLMSEPTWLRRVQQQYALMEPPTPPVKKPTLSSILSERGVRGALFLIAETLFITRPLIYVLLIRKYGPQSWFPWFLSLALDLIGVGMFSPFSYSGSGNEDKKIFPSPLEKDEMKRRKLLWALYVMRDPFFGRHTRGRLERTGKVLEPVPLIGVLTEKVIELITGAQSRYTYMSGS